MGSLAIPWPKHKPHSIKKYFFFLTGGRFFNNRPIPVQTRPGPTPKHRPTPTKLAHKTRARSESQNPIFRESNTLPQAPKETAEHLALPTGKATRYPQLRRRERDSTPTCCGRGRGMETPHPMKQHQAPGPTKVRMEPLQRHQKRER